MTMSAIAVSGLHKSYGAKTVLDGIDLEVAEGTIFSLLGPNGAGKTTMVQILSTLIGADAGSARVAGHDLVAEPDAIRAEIRVPAVHADHRDPAWAADGHRDRQQRRTRHRLVRGNHGRRLPVGPQTLRQRSERPLVLDHDLRVEVVHHVRQFRRVAQDGLLRFYGLAFQRDSHGGASDQQ